MTEAKTAKTKRITLLGPYSTVVCLAVVAGTQPLELYVTDDRMLDVDTIMEVEEYYDLIPAIYNGRTWWASLSFSSASLSGVQFVHLVQAR